MIDSQTRRRFKKGGSLLASRSGSIPTSVEAVNAVITRPSNARRLVFLVITPSNQRATSLDAVITPPRERETPLDAVITDPAKRATSFDAVIAALQALNARPQRIPL
jgi:hypothetical protein